MAGGKPLTGFILALSQWPQLLAEFNHPDPERRDALLAEWGLEGHPLLSSTRTSEPTLQQIQDAVDAEHNGEGQSSAPLVGVAWWIWFFGDPT